MHLTAPFPFPQAEPTEDRGQGESQPRERQQLGERQLVFTSSQAAEYLGVSLATIRRWADAGYISCYRTPGSQRRFSRRQLDEFISSLQRPGHHEHTRRAA